MTGRLDIRAVTCDPANGCVTSIAWADGAIPVESWGCEFGNWYGFFSQARMGGANVRVIERQIEVTEQTVRNRFEVALPHGRYRFEGSEAVADGLLRRTYRLEAVEPSVLGDFVTRLGLAAGRWPRAFFGDTGLDHRGRNRMVQRAERTVRFPCDGLRLGLVSALTGVTCPPSLDVLTYLRDDPAGLWIAHHRLLTRNGESDEYVFRFRHAALSSYQHRWLGCRPMRRVFWRLAERRPGLLPVTVQLAGNIELQAGQSLSMEAETRLEDLGGAG